MPTALIGAGTSIIGGILGSRASSKAAKAQQEAVNRAMGYTQEQTNRADEAQWMEENAARREIGAGYDTAMGQLNPYSEMGRGQIPLMQQLLDPSGALGLGGKLGQGVSAADVQAQLDPSMQFQIDQATKAIQASAAAKGGLMSGGTGKSLAKYITGMASTDYGNAFNRAMANLQNQQQSYGQLLSGNMGLLGAGQQASMGMASTAQEKAQLSSNLAQNMAQLRTGTYMGGAKSISDLLTQGGNAQASGYMGGANAWSNALGGIGKSFSDWFTNRNSNDGGGGGGMNISAFAPNEAPNFGDLMGAGINTGIGNW